MRRRLVAVGLLLALLLVADRVTAVVAANAVAAQLQSSGELDRRPMVSIRGFPFLTQAFAGRYERVELKAHDLQRRELRLTSMDVTVRGARVPLRAALFGTVDAVPVESLSATGLVGFAELAKQSDLPDASLAPAGNQLDVTARVTVFGRALTVTSRSTLALEGSTLVLTPQSVTVRGGSSDAVDAVLRDRLALRVSVGTLPYGLRLTGVRVTKQGLRLSARSGPTVLQRL
ncbi:MAG: uncharacterized protein JWN31_546 [Frankiales bacterium]|nr:uncharacterized protein [Frankiales bacterium]